MHDTLAYMARDPIHRSHHQGELSFGLVYAFNENFVLPLSHDEVVHGKGSLIAKMPGDGWQQFANLRAYYGFMWGHPGKKLLFMGGEFAQRREWNHDSSLDWHLLQPGADPAHAGLQAPGARPEHPAPSPCRRCTSATSRPTASSGSAMTMPPTACWPSCAMAKLTPGRCWWSATSRRWCTTAGGWACHAPAPGPSG